jgi:hypothetical protein
MSDEMTEQQVQPLGRWAKHRFMLLVGVTILISLFLVGVSLALYASSGAEQLDLSRPGYISVRSQAVRSEEIFTGFPSSGAMNATVINQFRALYKKQAEQATEVDGFGGDVMDDSTLGIDAPVTTPPAPTQ